MDIREKIKQIRKKYGEMVVEIDGETVTFKPTVEFYEGLLLSTTNPETAGQEAAKYFIKEFPKIVAKDLSVPIEDAKLFVMEYAEQLVQAFAEAIGKKK